MIIKRRDRVAVVIPVFNDRNSLRVLLTELASLHDQYELEIIIVDDGSTETLLADNDVEPLPFALTLLELPQNVGHQHAIAIGLEHAVTMDGLAAIVIMDGDGEDRPHEIPGLVEPLKAASVRGRSLDVVVAKRGRRSEDLVFRIFYRLYRSLFSVLAGRRMEFGNFCALTPQAAARILQIESTRLHVSATILKSPLHRASRVVDRGSRYRGNSKMNLISLTNHGLRSLAVFSDIVLGRMILMSSAAVGISVCLICLALALKIAGLTSPGWFTVAAGILLVIIAQSGTIAIVALLFVINGQTAAGTLPAPKVQIRAADRWSAHPAELASPDVEFEKERVA